LANSLEKRNKNKEKTKKRKQKKGKEKDKKGIIQRPLALFGLLKYL